MAPKNPSDLDIIELEAGETAIVFRSDGRIVLYTPEGIRPDENDLVLRLMACVEALQDDKMRVILFARVLQRNLAPDESNVAGDAQDETDQDRRDTQPDAIAPKNPKDSN